MYLNINTIKVKHDKKVQTYENNYNGMCEP